MPICTAPRLRGPSASSFTATSAGFSGWPVYGAVGDQLVDALLVSLSTGGELSHSLDDLATQAQAELEIRASIRAEQWKARVTALALALTPGLLLLWMRLVAPDAVAAFDLPVGQVVMLACAVMCGVGYLAVLRVGQVPERRRLYADAGSAEGSLPAVIGYVLWPVLGALGLTLLLVAQPVGSPRPRLRDWLARQDVALREAERARRTQRVGSDAAHGDA